MDERGQFIVNFARPRGKVHDARMLRASDFYTVWHENMGDNNLLGDSGYIGQAFPFGITPKCGNGALAEADEQQNSRISPGKVLIEQAFGMMKCKWRCPQDGELLD